MNFNHQNQEVDDSNKNFHFSMIFSLFVLFFDLAVFLTNCFSQQDSHSKIETDDNSIQPAGSSPFLLLGSMITLTFVLPAFKVILFSGSIRLHPRLLDWLICCGIIQISYFLGNQMILILSVSDAFGFALFPSKFTWFQAVLFLASTLTGLLNATIILQAYEKVRFMLFNDDLPIT
jgi:hypothetical protein